VGAGKNGLRGGSRVSCGSRADRTCCGDDDPPLPVPARDAAMPVADGGAGTAVNAFGLEGLASPHLGKEMEQSHARYSRWQSLHPTMGEYQSRPQAKVVSTVVKFAMYEINGVLIESGRLVLSYVAAFGGDGSGTAYPTEGQKGREWTRGHVNAAEK